MKQILFAIMLSLFAFSVSAQIQLPRLITGTIWLPDGTSPGKNIRFIAWLNQDQTDTLTQVSPGCGVNNSRWYLNAGNFNGGWSIGDTLFIRFMDFTTKSGVNYRHIITENNPELVVILERPAEITGLNGFSLNRNATFKGQPVKFKVVSKSIPVLHIYSTDGRLVFTNSRWNEVEPGVYTLSWSGLSSQGELLKEGTYVFNLSAGSETKTGLIGVIR
ncbi:MAG: hypothetical protein J0L62_06115 [Bacteroidetes bacterium]|nr:hypothetical protein [Bacteroidota bacterium]